MSRIGPQCWLRPRNLKVKIQGNDGRQEQIAALQQQIADAQKQVAALAAE